MLRKKVFFKEEGITVDYKWFDSSNAVNVAVASNNVDVGAAGFTADLYNMVAAGQKVSIVADKGKEEKGYQLSALLVHKDSPIKTIEDLKGKKNRVNDDRFVQPLYVGSYFREARHDREGC